MYSYQPCRVVVKTTWKHVRKICLESFLYWDLWLLDKRLKSHAEPNKCLDDVGEIEMKQSEVAGHIVAPDKKHSDSRSSDWQEMHWTSYLGLLDGRQQAPQPCRPCRVYWSQWERHGLFPKRRGRASTCRCPWAISVPSTVQANCVLKIYLFLAVLGLCCCMWAFSSCGDWRLLSAWGAWLLIAMASLVAKHGLSNCGSWA